MSGIHKRCHYAQKTEFELLARLFASTLPPEYPYNVEGGNRMIKAEDFDDRVDIQPVSDPNIFSSSQRIMMAQTQLQLAQANPEIHNQYEAYRRMYEALGVQAIEAILPPPAQPQALDPATENAQALGLMSLIVFQEQNHEAHIEAHRAFMSSALVRNNVQVSTILQGHITEHVGAMARLEVMQEIQPQLVKEAERFGGKIPDDLQAQFNAQIESQVAIKIAAMMDNMVAEEQESLPIDGAQDDPLVEIKNREIDIEEKRLNLKAADDIALRKIELDKLNQRRDIDQQRVNAQYDIADQRTDVQRERIDVQRERDNAKT